MTRQTSIDAYRTIMEDGTISKKRKEIYDILFRHGPLTANETFKILKKEKYGNLSFDSNTHARFTELRDMGLTYEVRTRPCSVTNRSVIEWDVTKRSKPIKFDKPKLRDCPTCKGTGKLKEQQARLF